MSALPEPDTHVEDHVILRLGDLAIKAGFPATFIEQRFLVSKTERTPISPRLALFGDIESVSYEPPENGRLVLTIVLKERAAP